MSPSAPAPLSFKETLRIRNVRRLWIAQLVSIFGDYLAVYAVFAIVTFQLHGTPFQVGMILVAFLTPIAIVSPFAGVYVDRWNVKYTMISSDLIRGVLVTILLFEHNLMAIYATLFLLSCVSSFFLPAQTVAIRAIAPANALVAANGLMAQAQQASQIVAPAVMGLVIQALGANFCFGFDCLSFFFSATLVSTISIERKSAGGPSASTVMQSMSQGLKFIFTHSALTFVILSMTAGMFAIRCFGALLSIYVRDILHSDTRMFGILNSLIGVGMIGGAQFMPRMAKKASHQHLVTYGLTGIGGAVLLSAVWPRLVPAAAALLAMGFFAAFVFVCTQVLIQEVTPHELLGRVSSTLMSLLCGAQVISLLGIGPMADRFGVIDVYYFSAAALGAIGAFGYWKLKTPRQATT